MIKVKIMLEDQIPVIKIEGELTYATKNKYYPLQTEVLKQARLSQYKIILDLTKIKYLDSKGLNCLIEMSEIIKLHDGKIGVVTDNPIFRRLFRFSQIAKFFEVYDSVPEATFAFMDFASP